MMSVIYYALGVFAPIISIFIMSNYGMFINRTVSNIPHDLLMNSIAILDEEENIYPYFIVDQLEDNLVSYFNSQLHNKVDCYYMSLYPFTKTDEGIFLDTSGMPQNVQLHFICDYYLDYKVDKKLVFSIDISGIVNYE